MKITRLTKLETTCDTYFAHDERNNFTNIYSPVKIIAQMCSFSGMLCFALLFSVNILSDYLLLICFNYLKM